MRGSWAIVVTLALPVSGCGDDPVLEAARKEAKSEASAGLDGQEPTSVSPRQAHPMDGGSPKDPSKPGGHTAGVPEEPTPGNPSDPSPDGVGTPGVGQPGEPAPGIPSGPTPVAGTDPEPVQAEGTTPPTGPLITLSGHISFDSYNDGSIRIDVFDGEHHGGGPGKRPSLLNSVTLTRLGPWSVEVEESVGQVWIEASNDENGNGRPDPRDPMGRCSRNPVSTKKSTEGLRIHLERRDAPGGAEDDL